MYLLYPIRRSGLCLRLCKQINQKGIGAPSIGFKTSRKLGRWRLRIHERKAWCQESGCEVQVSWVRAQGDGCHKNQSLLLKEVGCPEQDTCAFLCRKCKTENLQRLLRATEQRHLSSTLSLYIPDPWRWPTELQFLNHWAILAIGQVHLRSPFKL